MPFRRLIVALILLVASATAAFAHAGLISTDPPDGSLVPDEPAGMTLVYTEPVSPIGFSIVGLTGAAIALTADRQDGPTVHVPFPPNLAKGSYLFSWRVTSEDGHPVNGTVGFAIGAPSGTIAAAAPDRALVALVWAVRAVQYIALFLGVGSAAFGTLQPLPPAARRVSRRLAIAGLVLVPVALVMQGLDLLGLPMGAAISAAPWNEAATSPYAATQGLLALAFVLALLPGRVTALAAGLAGALAPTLSGHASTADPAVLMHAAVFVHIASLMFWLGALLPLFVLLRTGTDPALHRFSRIIPWVVAALLASGITLAVVQLGPPRPDWMSPYGALLAAKLVLVALLLLLALWNRVRLTAAADAGQVRPLRRSIAIELILVAVILCVVAGWRFTTPPRVLAQIEAASAPVTVALTAPSGSASMVVTPGRPGLVSLRVDLPVAAEEVTVMLENPGGQIATIGRKATLVGGETWRIDALMLPTAGEWSVGVAARTSKFDITTYTGTLALAGKEATMNATAKAVIAASSMLLATPALAAGVIPSCPTGQNFTHGDLTITGAFTRAMPKGAQSAGGYLTIRNGGSSADTLTGASSDAAGDVSLHVMKMNGNVMEMAPVDGVPVPPGGSATLGPMGYHLMMTGLAQQFTQGQCVQMTLHFAKTGDLPIQLNVGSFAQATPPTSGPASSMEMSGMDMSSMSSMAGM